VAALDDQIRETVNRLLDSLRGRLESELSSSQDELVRNAREASARIAAEAAEHATAEAKREADQQVAAVQSRLDEALACAKREAEEHQQRLDETRRQLDDTEKEAEAARERLESLTKELEDARTELESTRDDVEATLRNINASRSESESAREEVNRLTVQLRNKDERASQARRLPEAIRALDNAATFSDVLDTLATLAGREAGRAAVFLVKGNRLRDWRTVGFDFTSDAPRLDIDVTDSGAMGEAVSSGSGVSSRAQSSVPEFARTDEARTRMAWPVAVGGSVVAVLYADGPHADNSDEPYWPVFLEVVSRHAGRVLEGITVRQAAGLMTGKSTGLASSPVTRQSSGSIQ
jgi:hypothetical protein